MPYLRMPFIMVVFGCILVASIVGCKIEVEEGGINAPPDSDIEYFDLPKHQGMVPSGDHTQPQNPAPTDHPSV